MPAKTNPRPSANSGIVNRGPLAESPSSKAPPPPFGSSSMNGKAEEVRPHQAPVSSPSKRKQIPMMNPSAALKQQSPRFVQIGHGPVSAVLTEPPAINQWEACLSCLRIGASCDRERPCQSCESTDCLYASDVKKSDRSSLNKVEAPIQKPSPNPTPNYPAIGLFAAIEAEEETDSAAEDEPPSAGTMKNIIDLESMLQELQHSMHRFQEYIVQPLLQQSRIDCTIRGTGPHTETRISPFAALRPKKVTQKTTSPKLHLSIRDYTTNAAGFKQNHRTISTPITEIDNRFQHLPRYKSIGRMQSSILARNVTVAKYNFYVADDENITWNDLTDKYQELGERYHTYDAISATLHEQRGCAELADLWRPWLDAMMTAAGCHWRDVLQYYTQERAQDQTENLKLPDSQLAQWLGEQTSTCRHCSTEYTPENEWHLAFPWDQVFTVLQQEDASYQDQPTDLSSAGLLCAAFHELTGMSLWHVVSTDRRVRYIFQNINKPSESKSLAQQMCVVCALHNCSTHGAYIENPDIRIDDRLDNIHINDDEAERNERLNISLPIRSQTDSFKAANKQRRRKKTVPVRKSKTNMRNNKNLEVREVFVPCSHSGACQDNPLCSCFKVQIACEHSCNCNEACLRRFKGCRCVTGPDRLCKDDGTCECWNNSRECDPWLCKSCGVLEVLDQANKYCDEIRKGRCCNNRCQLGIPAHTIKAPSEVQGYGLFAGENLREGDFIGEYKGEIISQPESDRRGSMYSLLGYEYLFILNAGQQVDASNFGNKTRFMNNSNLDRNINVSGCLMLCSGVHRIMLYAKRNIKAGEELLYNYAYPEETSKHFWERGEESSSKKAALRAKDTVSKTVKSGKRKYEAMVEEVYGSEYETESERYDSEEDAVDSSLETSAESEPEMTSKSIRSERRVRVARNGMKN